MDWEAWIKAAEFSLIRRVAGLSLIYRLRISVFKENNGIKRSLFRDQCISLGLDHAGGAHSETECLGSVDCLQGKECLDFSPDPIVPANGSLTGRAQSMNESPLKNPHSCCFSNTPVKEMNIKAFPRATVMSGFLIL